MTSVSEPVAQPTIRQTDCFIDGQWQPSQSGKTFETRHPANEEVITQIAEGDAADVDLAVKAARHAFDNGPWRSMDARERGELLHRLADRVNSIPGHRGFKGFSENVELVKKISDISNGEC